MQLPISVGPREIIDSYLRSNLASLSFSLAVSIEASFFKELSIIFDILGSSCSSTTVVRQLLLCRFDRQQVSNFNSRLEVHESIA